MGGSRVCVCVGGGGVHVCAEWVGGRGREGDRLLYGGGGGGGGIRVCVCVFVGGRGWDPWGCGDRDRLGGGGGCEGSKLAGFYGKKGNEK